MKIIEGSTRNTLIIGSIAIKYPRLKRIISLLWDFDIRSALRLLYCAIEANRSEYRCWTRIRPTFLAPTRFNLILFNIQKSIEGRVVSEEEIKKVLSKLSDETRLQLKRVDPHLYDGNFIHDGRGYKLIDYADMPVGYSLTHFIREHKEELEALLSQKAM